MFECVNVSEETTGCARSFCACALAYCCCWNIPYIIYHMPYIVRECTQLWSEHTHTLTVAQVATHICSGWNVQHTEPRPRLKCVKSSGKYNHCVDIISSVPALRCIQFKWGPCSSVCVSPCFYTHDLCMWAYGGPCLIYAHETSRKKTTWIHWRRAIVADTYCDELHTSEWPTTRFTWRQCNTKQLFSILTPCQVAPQKRTHSIDHRSASQHRNGRLLDNELALPICVCVFLYVSPCLVCELACKRTTRRVLAALRDHLTCRVRSPQARIMTSGATVCTLAAAHPMAWTNERLKLSCADGIGFKSLWKMLALDKSGDCSGRSNSDVSVIIMQRRDVCARMHRRRWKRQLAEVLNYNINNFRIC